MSERFGKSQNRLPAQILSDRVLITEMYLRAVPQYKIAEELGLSPATITNELKKIRQLWLDAQITNFNERQVTELAKIDKLESEAWVAWDKSKEGETTTTKKVIDKLGGIKAGVTKEDADTFKPSPGNPAYLNKIQWCIETRIKMFGLAASIEVNWKAKVPEGVKVEEIEERLIKAITDEAGNREEYSVSTTRRTISD